MIIFDTETTNVFNSVDAPLHTLPKIIELYALKVTDDDLTTVSELHLLIDPKEKLSEEIVKITSITDDMVKGKGDYAFHFQSIVDFWLGERWACGHNVTFDCEMLEIENKRIGKVCRFPWTPKRLCTVEASEHYQGRRLKLIDLHKHLTGEGFESAHRAKADVMATYRCILEMKKLGDLPDL